ncbi:MAG: hypothetical protein E6K73_13600 [Candidatus Eisenbacteria bacterium]|uniref:Uncharacterized protein n=1 Tax=Eiseniibacteriota bacterium TaxID=2212470 RepID=A0A538S7Z6_UNCEI|nr:MAG: hypothetical protein E6K73_13600 [Candidatus Eisenbacteria bacterium]
MISVLALAFLAASAPSTGYTSWVKNGEAHIRFYDLSKIHGPFKFYVSSSGCPDAGCPTCPSGSGTTADCVVTPDKVYQKWQPNRDYVETIFSLSEVHNMQYFYFTAVTCTADADMYLCGGEVPEGAN